MRGVEGELFETHLAEVLNQLIAPLGSFLKLYT
jgi:hypothetical protein